MVGGFCFGVFRVEIGISLFLIICKVIFNWLLLVERNFGGTNFNLKGIGFIREHDVEVWIRIGPSGF